MLIDSRCIPDIIDKLKPECFYLEKNREIFEIIYDVYVLPDHRPRNCA